MIINIVKQFFNNDIMIVTTKIDKVSIKSLWINIAKITYTWKSKSYIDLLQKRERYDFFQSQNLLHQTSIVIGLQKLSFHIVNIFF